MTNRREVVITGSGVVSPIGIGNQAFWESVTAGRSGVERLTFFDPSALPVPFGAEIKGFQPKEFVTPRKSLKVMCREIQTGFTAARLALTAAALEPENIESDRFGVLYGSELFYADPIDEVESYQACIVDGQFETQRWGEQGLPKKYPLWMLLYLPNMPACHIGIAFDARGHNNSITQGEASSLLAFIEAVRVIERGLVDVMIAGGTGSRINITPIMYRSDSNLSHRSDNPAAASRPFDADRDGMVNGEGAGAFVLESREHAEARGATIYARVLGCGMAFDGYGETRLPQSAGIQQSMRLALAEAGLSAAEVGHVNAHGVSTVEGDVREAVAIRAVLGDVPVTAPKSFFGNLGAGSGAVEMAASLLALEHNLVPITLNYERPDPRCDVRVVHGQPLEGQPPTAMVLSQSGTGQTAAVLIGR